MSAAPEAGPTIEPAVNPVFLPLHLGLANALLATLGAAVLAGAIFVALSGGADIALYESSGAPPPIGPQQRAE